MALRLYGSGESPHGELSAQEGRVWFFSSGRILGGAQASEASWFPGCLLLSVLGSQL